MVNETEEELVTKAQAGERIALEELLRRNRRLLYSIARRYALHYEDADDLVQEAHLRAIRNIHSFRREASFSSWLATIGIHAAISEKRKSRYRQHLSIDAEIESDNGSTMQPYYVVAREPDPEQSLMRKELSNLLRYEMQKVLPSKRAVLNAIYVDDLPVQDAAAKLGISVSAAKARLQRGRHDLATAFTRRRYTSAAHRNQMEARRAVSESL
jgi:RNA polymerase sigma-70 factor (ECF subfamily)